jgi:hypothetical protein
MAAANQSRAAAADPQVPGPGRSSPAPRKVPTAQAHPVFLPTAASLITGQARPHPFNLFQKIGIEHRRGNTIYAAGPFPQVDGLAMFAAEGKIRIVHGDELPACRAAQAFKFFSRGTHLHISLRSFGDNSAYQIVILRLGNLALVKMPGVQLIKGSKVVDKNLAIDLRSLMLRAALP